MRAILRRTLAVGLVGSMFCWPLSPIAFASDHPGVPPSLSTGGSSPGAPGGPTSQFSLTVSPTRLAIGQTELSSKHVIQVLNNSAAPERVESQLRNFVAGADGSVTFQEAAPYSASGWVTVTPSSFTIPAGGLQVVTIGVDAPERSEPGDHQVTIVFVVPSAKTDANIQVNRGIGIPIYITAPGPIDDTVVLTSMDAPGFATGGPVDITATMKNTGTVHKDYRGASPLMVDAPGDSAPFPDFTVLRDSVRNISTTWDPPLIGIFHPTVTLTNADGTTSSRSVQVIIFPIQKALILLGVLAILFFGFWFIRRRYKSSVRKAAVAMNRPAAQGDA